MSGCQAWYVAAGMLCKLPTFPYIWEEFAYQPIYIAGNVYFPVKAAKGKGLVAGRGRKPLGYTELTTGYFPQT